MRILLCFAIMLLSATACKKQVEARQEDLLLKLITSGEWAVTKYTKGSSEITAGFSPYSFQFKKDFTVTAINNGTVEETGTWSGSIATKTVAAQFSTSNPILVLLNGTWQVTDSGLDYVESTQTVNGEYRFLRLVKK